LKIKKKSRLLEKTKKLRKLKNKNLRKSKRNSKCCLRNKDKILQLEFGDVAKLCCYPLYLFNCHQNSQAAKTRVMKMEVRDSKLALHGIEFLHCDRAKPNEHLLFRMDGNLTNQHPQMIYDETGQAKIVPNQV